MDPLTTMLDQESQSSPDPLGYYRTLGVGPLADSSEIKAAFRYKAKLLHPDRNPSEEARQEFNTVLALNPGDANSLRQLDALAAGASAQRQ